MKNRQPIVSVIVPAYNAAKTINRVIDNLLGQKNDSLEIVVVNDGSTDDTAKVLDKYRDDKRVVVISQENAGASAARNTGIQNAHGKYLMFADADDDFAPNFIATMVNAMTSERAGIVICGHGGDGVRSLLPDVAGLIKKNLPKHVCASILKNGLLYPTWNKIYLARIVKEKNIFFDETIGYGEDLIFNLNYLKYIDSIFYIKEPLYIYIYRPGGLSAKTKSNLHYRYEMLAALRDYLGNNLKKPDVALKYQLIRMRWIISANRMKREQGRKQHE